MTRFRKKYLSVSKINKSKIFKITLLKRSKVFMYFKNWIEYDLGFNYTADYKGIGITFESKSKGKLLSGSYSIEFGRKL